MNALKKDGGQKPGRKWDQTEVNDVVVPKTRERDAAYALCNVMYNTIRCSCQKNSYKPCNHMVRGVQIVQERLNHDS